MKMPAWLLETGVGGDEAVLLGATSQVQRGNGRPPQTTRDFQSHYYTLKQGLFRAHFNLLELYA